jgi:hypothetical protein
MKNYFMEFVSPHNKQKLENGVYFKENKVISIRELIHLVNSNHINPFHEANRQDRNNLDKKRGILSSIVSNVDMGTICLRVENEYGYDSMIIDGGHRVRAITEFTQDKFKLGKSRYINENAKHIDVSGMNYSEIKNVISEFGDFFLDFKICLTLFYNMPAEQFTLQAVNMNQSSKLSGSEVRNFFVDNIITTAVRKLSCYNTVTKNVPHPLFQKEDITKNCSDILELTDEQMEYFSIVERIFYFCAMENASLTCEDSELNDFFEEYGSITYRGKYVVNQKAFNQVLQQTENILDLLYKIFSAWPKKRLVKIEMRTVLAVLRFLFALNDDVKAKYKAKYEIIDVSKFAEEFQGMMNTLIKEYNGPNNLGTWAVGDKTARTYSNAFKAYVASVKAQTKIMYAKKMLLDEFDDRFEQFGIKIIDQRVTFNIQDQYTRFNEIGQVCEVSGIPLKFDDVQGDHAIPRSWGILNGGVTELSNLRILHKDINNHKGAREFEEYKASGDWKPIAERLLKEQVTS